MPRKKKANKPPAPDIEEPRTIYLMGPHRSCVAEYYSGQVIGHERFYCGCRRCEPLWSKSYIEVKPSYPPDGVKDAI